jgi:lysophospholipase L1-like esterase
LPPQLGQELYSRYASSFIDSEYKTKLSKCVELVQNYNQDCHVFLMTPIAPTHKKICYMTEVFYKHYQLVHQVADCYSGVKVADIYTPLKVCSSGEVYQADGTHLTDKGQKVVAEAIIKNLETVIKKGLK